MANRSTTLKPLKAPKQKKVGNGDDAHQSAPALDAAWLRLRTDAIDLIRNVGGRLAVAVHLMEIYAEEGDLLHEFSLIVAEDVLQDCIAQVTEITEREDALIEKGGA